MKTQNVALIVVGSIVVVAMLIRFSLLMVDKFNNSNNQPTTIGNQVTPPVTNEPIVNEPVTEIANPASTNCVAKGGETVIQTRPDGAQYGLCMFQENRACEEWAMLRGDCPVGGMKTTGYDTVEQKFCAWAGGQTVAQENAVCTFKDGTKCDNKAFYEGSCPKK